MLDAAFALGTGQLVVLAIAAVLGGLVFGVTGFAFGVVASLFLHHALPPRDVIFILVSGGLVLNISSLPRFARKIQWSRAMPFLAGATFGMPLGLLMLRKFDPPTLRIASGALILGYCLFAWRQHRRPAFRLGSGVARGVDVLVGFTGGIVGGVAGLGPLIPGVWYGLLGLGKSDQRALAQPFGLYVQGFLVAALVFSDGVSVTALSALLLVAPILLMASAVGLRVFDKVSVVQFQRTVLAGCIVGAVLLIARQLV